MGFAEKTYEILKQLSPDLPKDYRRFISAIQDMGEDYPKEKKFLGRFADERFIEICTESAKREEKTIANSVDRATDYLRDEMFLEEKWARHLSEQMILAVWAYENHCSPDWIRTHTRVLTKCAEQTEMVFDDDENTTEIIAESEHTNPDKDTRRKAELYPSIVLQDEWSEYSHEEQNLNKTRKKNNFFLILLGIVAIAIAFVIVLVVLFGVFSSDDESEDKAITEKTKQTETTPETTSEDESSEPENEDGRLGPEERVYAHRGAGGSEDTFAGFDSAIDQGATHIEQDVVFADDGEFYVSLSPISEYTSSSADLNSQGKLRLREVFDRYGEGITYVIELKTTSSQATSALIALIWEYGNGDNIIVQCFEKNVLSQVKDAIPEVETLFLCDINHGGQEKFVSALSLGFVDSIGVSYNDGMMTYENLVRTHDAGKTFCAWVLDEESQIREAIEMGVDCYFTRNPGKAIVLEKEYRDN